MVKYASKGCGRNSGCDTENNILADRRRSFKVIESKVDVRTICSYVDSGVPEGQSVKRKRRSSQKTWQDGSKANLKDSVME